MSLGPGNHPAHEKFHVLLVGKHVECIQLAEFDSEHPIKVSLDEADLERLNHRDEEDLRHVSAIADNSASRQQRGEVTYWSNHVALMRMSVFAELALLKLTLFGHAVCHKICQNEQL